MELYSRKGKSLDREALLDNCTGMGMDTSCLVFYHCDLGPGNIIVEPATRGIGIIDWEIAESSTCLLEYTSRTSRARMQNLIGGVALRESWLQEGFQKQLTAGWGSQAHIANR